MGRKTVMVIADLGGCPPHMFYESVAEKYNIVSYIPRPFAITQSHASLIEKYSVAVVKDMEYFKDINDFEHPNSIYWAQKEYNKPENEVIQDIVTVAKMFNVSAITTNNELFVVPMAKACEELGLRGAGVTGAINARDKNLMRETFNKSGIKSIKSMRVSSLEDFRMALAYVGVPAVLKPTYLASSIGVTLINNKSEAEKLFLKAQKFLEGISVPNAISYQAPFILEEYLQGSYNDWYDVEGYADYVSVEGMMVDGKYYPLVIHDKTPQIGFVETAHITSSILDEDAKKRIIETVKKANESLGLQFCATHTEVKLMKNREVGVIESAARFAGWNMIPNIKKVYGIDAAKILVDILCNGYSEDLPKELLDNPKRYIADLHLYPTDFKRSGQLPSDINEFTFEDITIPENVLVGDTKIVSVSKITKGTKIDLSLFEAFNTLAAIELTGSSSLDITKSIYNIKNSAKLVLGEVYAN